MDRLELALLYYSVRYKKQIRQTVTLVMWFCLKKRLSVPYDVVGIVAPGILLIANADRFADRSTKNTTVTIEFAAEDWRNKNRGD